MFWIYDFQYLVKQSYAKPFGFTQILIMKGYLSCLFVMFNKKRKKNNNNNNNKNKQNTIPAKILSMENCEYWKGIGVANENRKFVMSNTIFSVGIISYSYMMYLVVSLVRKVVKMYFTDNYIMYSKWWCLYCGCILMGFGN